MRRILPRTRMGIFTFVLIVLLAAKWFLWPSGLALFALLFAVPAVYYSWKLFALLRRKLLWKIRRRLILAHVFIGAIPVFLVVLIVYVAGLLFYYQLVYYLVSNQIGIHSAQIHAFNLSLREGLQQAITGRNLDVAELRTTLDRDSKYLLGAYPSASIVLHVQDPSTDKPVIFGNRNVNLGSLEVYQIPHWAGDREFSGLVVEDSQPALYRRNGDKPKANARGRLYLRSLVFSEVRPEVPFSVEVSVPLDRYLLDRLKAAVGLDLLLADNVSASGLSVMLQNTDILQNNILCATFDSDKAQGVTGRPVWSILLFPVSWNTGMEMNFAASDILFVELSTSRLFQNLFRSESNVSKTILGVLETVVVFFLIVEVFSLIMGVVLTKSITTSVYNLDRGTEFIKRGDFSHRIVSNSDDQLGALAASFNQMTEYIQGLVKERVQKERLERELEIAKEVQEQLFPRSAPQTDRMDLSGLCLPARMVSGDYYDFLPAGGQRIGLALGDICGKGISAALLMANLQATLRSNVINLARKAHSSGGGDTEDNSVAQVVRILNEQIYNYTAANKFASFFYAVYDESRLSLTYCNAGHNPPLYFNGDGVQQLRTGGTVVGIFPDAQYDQETLALHSGDLLFAYTDGIVESVNEYGEEFGEERLIELVRKNRNRSAADIQNVVVDQVLSWAFDKERDDDMTLLIARFH